MSRFTIEFSEEVDKQIEIIQESTGATTKADVIRKALGVLTYIVEEKNQGGKVLIENEKQNLRKELVTL